MSIGVNNFQGRRLKEARLARGLFKSALGEMIGVTGTAITRYEDGVDRPTPQRVHTLAHKLNFPENFFLKPVWDEEIDLVHWRSRASESKGAREMTEQRMRWLCEIFSFLESEVDFSHVPLPEFNLPNNIEYITGELIEEIALQIREYWGLRLEPIPDMILALENMGIPVVALNISSDKQDGFCFKSDTLKRTFVGINIENTSPVRARLDAAHELGHIILHKNVSPKTARNPVVHKLMEKQAFRFAGALLFPRKAFLREVGGVSLDELSAVKRRWGMAISAMIVRAGDLEIIGREETAFLFRKMTKRRWRGPLREPFDMVMKLERPRMLRRGFEAIFNSGMFSTAAILSVLPHPPRDIEEIAALEQGALTGARVPSLEVSLKEKGQDLFDLESGKVIPFFPRR